VGWGRAQQQQQKSTAAAAATAARQGQNEMNTAMTRNMLRACEVLYSESLTNSTIITEKHKENMRRSIGDTVDSSDY
jgi:hypothetical protein